MSFRLNDWFFDRCRKKCILIWCVSPRQIKFRCRLRFAVFSSKLFIGSTYVCYAFESSRFRHERFAVSFGIRSHMGVILRQHHFNFNDTCFVKLPAGSSRPNVFWITKYIVSWKETRNRSNYVNQTKFYSFSPAAYEFGHLNFLCRAQNINASFGNVLAMLKYS